MKICKECKYVKYQSSDYPPDCTHLSAIYEVSPISGKVSRLACNYMRDKEDLCGKEGSLFEPKLSIWKRWFKNG